MSGVQHCIALGGIPWEALVVGVGGGECILAAAIQLKGFVVVLINQPLHWGCALMMTTLMMTRVEGLCWC